MQIVVCSVINHTLSWKLPNSQQSHNPLIRNVLLTLNVTKIGHWPKFSKSTLCYDVIYDHNACVC